MTTRSFIFFQYCEFRKSFIKGYILDVLLSGRFSHKGILYESNLQLLERLKEIKAKNKSENHTLWDGYTI